MSFACGRVVPWDIAIFLLGLEGPDHRTPDHMVDARHSKEPQSIVPEATIALTSSR